MFKFELGDRVKDAVTGFKGVVVAQTKWLNGCIRYNVQSEKLKDGRPQDAYAFDEEQLSVVGSPIKIKQQPTGGPRPDVTRGNTVSR